MRPSAALRRSLVPAGLPRRRSTRGPTHIGRRTTRCGSGKICSLTARALFSSEANTAEADARNPRERLPCTLLIAHGLFDFEHGLVCERAELLSGEFPDLNIRRLLTPGPACAAKSFDLRGDTDHGARLRRCLLCLLFLGHIASAVR